MALSDDCAEFVDDLRPKLIRFQQHVAEYHGQPWEYDSEILTTVGRATVLLSEGMRLLNAARRSLDAPASNT